MLAVAPSDKIRRRAHEEGITEGPAWIRYSLQSHTMSAQLRALVSDRQNLLIYYHGEQYLERRGFLPYHYTE